MPPQKYLLMLLLSCMAIASSAQNNYWQQETNYRIQVSLNTRQHTLDGHLELHYFNRSPDTLKSIWFHLWPNAYRTDQTAFSDQLLENGRTDFYFSEQEERGYINRLDFLVNQKRSETKDHPQHIDIQELLLPSALPPGDSCIITTPFHVQLPKNFSRGGYYKHSFQVTQWFPKAAVYDRKGWHLHPYLDQGEFYADFGNYEVEITAPASLTIISTGFEENVQTSTYPTNAITKNSKADTSSLKTWTFRQQQVHDFAWFADTQWKVLKDTLQLPSGRIIDLTAAFQKGNEVLWQNSLQMMKKALLFRSKLIGEYPYLNCSVVETYMGFPGGMEYPCITSVYGSKDASELESVIQHEIGHNWFQGMIGTDERRFPWLDEGINTYYDLRYQSTQSTPDGQTWDLTKRIDDIILTTYERMQKDQPLSTASELLSPVNYYQISYQKGAAFMQLLENTLGRNEMDKGMQHYFEKWKYKHPYPDDLKRTLEESSGKNLDSLFALLDKKGALTPFPKRKFSFGFPFKLNAAERNVINLTPAVGYNLYDGWMFGGMLSNYNLPPTKFQFLAAPLYGTTSKRLNGAGRLSLTTYPKNGFAERIQYSVSLMKFTKGDFTDTAGKNYHTGFTKLTPGIKLFLREKKSRSTRERFIQWRTFLIQEENLRFQRDSFPNGNLFTTITTPRSFRYLNQLRFVVTNYRVLYPYQAEAQIEQTKDFIRLAFTGNYHLNYNQKHGADVRLFAGKFMNIGNPDLSTRFRNDRYFLNMTGPKGNEDYTYSHYFIGRTEFEGLASQQIALRDGGFKVRTDLLADKVGKTDNWLAALNLVTDIPDQINLMNILPFKIPLRAYLDIGTYAEAWSDKTEGIKLLYNAGLQLSLLNQSVQIYFPLFYSKVYRDYFQSTFPDKRFLRTCSFIINLQNLNLKTIDKRLSL